MKEASLQRDARGYTGEWKELRLSEDGWRRELEQEAGSEIVTEQMGYGETLEIYFEDGLKAIVDSQ